MALVPQPTALRVRNAKRELLRQWIEANGDEPYEMTSTQTFDAFRGVPVAVIRCRTTLPVNMKWSDPNHDVQARQEDREATGRGVLRE